MTENITLPDIASAVSGVTGISIEKLMSREKTEKISIARGIYYLIARELGFHPINTSQYVGRSRAACITTTKQYRGYYESGDKIICKLIRSAKILLSEHEMTHEVINMD